MSAQNDSIKIAVQGRIVWGTNNKSLFQGKEKKDSNGQIRKNDKGEVMMDYGFGLAVPMPGPQSSPEAVKNFQDLWQAMHQAALALYPGAQQVPNGFSMKYKLPTDVDHRGQVYSGREGYAGCIVIACTSSLPTKFYKHQGPGWTQVNEGIKCGDYVQVSLEIRGHLPKPGTQGKPGLYLNPNFVAFLQHGQEIVGGPDVEEMLGTGPIAVPSWVPAPPAQAAAPQFTPPGSYAPQGPGPAVQHAPYPGILPQAVQQAVAPTPGYGGQAYPPPGVPVPNGGAHQQPGGYQPAPGGYPNPNVAQGAPVIPQYGAPSQGYPQPTGQNMNPGGTVQPAYPSNPMGPWVPPQS